MQSGHSIVTAFPKCTPGDIGEGPPATRPPSHPHSRAPQDLRAGAIQFFTTADSRAVCRLRRSRAQGLPLGGGGGGGEGGGDGSRDSNGGSADGGGGGRTATADATVEAIVPGLDFCNHGARPNCRWTVQGTQVGPAELD